ncbi:MAG TPA: dTDP-4-dehydrorhamnose 3,5-epimerase family protein [Albitalea sp.]|nr:dTDP-4-dehydrorhamnose 3,5-epimerase family protein [Albitalea sp.]
MSDATGARFSVADTPLPGLKLVVRQRVGDARGFLSRLFCADELRAAGWTRPVSQINHTFTARRGTVRGLHFQHPPHAEAKLVSCLRGEVWDVAVDLREGSPTFLRWHAARLSADNRQALLIPEGFAHGFQTLCDEVEMLYCHSAAYNAGAEGGLNVRDPSLAIDWPLPIAEVSPRDAGHPFVGGDFKGVRA